MEGFSISDLDLPYEEEILRNPYTLKSWQRYINHKKEHGSVRLNLVYERALKELPGSYKLWKTYLDRRRKHAETKPRGHVAYERVNNCYERALVFMHKMPRIWLDYCEFLISQKCITRIRRTFDRALMALPITQHERVWELYIKFIRQPHVPLETSIRVYRRYLKLEPDKIEEYIEFLTETEHYSETVTRLAEVVNNDKFVSVRGKSNYQLWMELAELACKHPEEIAKTGLNVEAIIRSGIGRFTDQVGRLWVTLAEYYILLELFEKARDIYEEGIATVTRVRDFSQIFDAYSKFEESLISKMMEIQESGDDGQGDQQLDLDLDIRMARFERLMDRRPFLLNDVHLRQNPNNVAEWQKRVALYKNNPEKIVETYTKALETIDPKLSSGNLPELWVQFARYYEEAGDMNSARIVMERAVLVDFKNVNDLAHVWCEYAEMEIRQSEFDKALELMGRATAPRRTRVNYHDKEESVQSRLHKSIKLWSFYVDLEESVGTVESTKSVYDRIIDLKIATPQIIINYALFLEEKNYFEDSFKAYEKGLELFKYPIAFEIWNSYLTKFVDRYGGKKIERARDLFEQALDKCPAEYAKTIYLLYANLEEKYGLARHAMKIYDRATKAVQPSDRLEIFNIYLTKAAETFGVTATREIYEKAIEVLPDKDARDICIRFADLERKLGEIDRARGIYSFASQFCDPRTAPSFWQVWHDFEVRHGNEETFREMLRVKRSVQAQYNTQVGFISAQIVSKAEQAAKKENAKGSNANAIELLEESAAAVAAFADDNDNDGKRKRDD